MSLITLAERRLRWSEQMLADHLADDLIFDRILQTRLENRVTFDRAELAYVDFVWHNSLPKPLDVNILETIKQSLLHNVGCLCGVKHDA